MKSIPHNYLVMTRVAQKAESSTCDTALGAGIARPSPRDSQHLGVKYLVKCTDRVDVSAG